MIVLFLGDIIGNPGRKCLENYLDILIREENADVVIANGENAAGGIGITPEISDTLLQLGIDVITSGNHIFKKKEILDYIDREPRLLKPANYPPDTPGNGCYIFSNKKTRGCEIAVFNLCGRVFIDNFDCPFRTADKVLSFISKKTSVIILDFHAEVTSEKMAIGWYLDGRVSAIIGTHTHIQTADERILNKGTAYITDVGMCGPRNSVIGVKKEIIVNRFINMMPHRFSVADSDNWISGAVIDIDETTGRANSIRRINRKIFD
ncbi:MAG: TIGR00282 family metallophosphoesterase [Actinobacteria bacterium]|nr:TIGR00282 family metallophosphoesterase [Actinomycetota bacterium]